MAYKQPKYKGLLKVKVIRKFREKSIKLARKLILPGFEGMPFYDVLVFFFNGIRKSSLISRANSLSFTFLLAIFPAIIFFFTLIPYIPIGNFQETIMETLSNILPDNAFKSVETTIHDLVIRHKGGLLSLGFFLTIYFSVNGVMGIMKAFNRTSHTIETRSKLKLFLISVMLVFIIVSTIILTTILLMGASYLINYFSYEDSISGPFTNFMIDLGKWFFTFLMIFIVISFIYYLAPARKRHFKFISVGSTFATLLSLLFIMGFNLYINNFSQYNVLYGSIGTLLILMIWINLNAIALLIGFELNASILDAKRKGLK